MNIDSTIAHDRSRTRKAVFAVQLLFVFNFFYSIFKGRTVTSLNPWQATTLEWTTPIHPPHGNWEGEIPEVHRWAYDYDRGERSFIPQTEPIGVGEESVAHVNVK